MLTRLIILNSTTYSKADIEFSDCDSIQLVGANNIGKSTLIYALNFLYIIDGKEMSFSGNRTGDKDTIAHYFPTINSSYIVFEVFKERYYSILIKRNSEGSLDYYRIESDYKEELYFVQTGAGRQLRNFENVLSNFAVKAILFSKFSNRRDVLNFVYQKGKRNNGVVWLSSSAAQDARGISNSFSKIYKYLINSKKVNNVVLRDALIIANNRENERVEFSKRDQRDIQTLLKHNNSIKVIQSITKSFLEFKELVKVFQAKGVILSELVFAFEQQYSFTFAELGTRVLEHKKERESNSHELNETLNPKRNNLNQEVGKLGVMIEQIIQEVQNLESSITEIKGFESLDFLEQSIHNLNNERKTIEVSLTEIENHGLKSDEIEKEIFSIQSNIDKLTERIEKYSSQLIHKISKNQKNREYINGILSKEVTSLTSKAIVKEIKNVDKLLSIFDGEISLPNGFEGRTIESIEDLELQLTKLNKAKNRNESLLPVVRDFEGHQKELATINQKINTLESKILQVKSIPELESKLALLSSKTTELLERQEVVQKELGIVEEQIVRMRDAVSLLTESIIKKEARIKEIQNWKFKVESYGINGVENQSAETFDNLYKKINLDFEERRDVQIQKEKLFERLKTKIEIAYSSEDEFIDYVESELTSIYDKEKSIDALLKSISTQFANPCRTLFARFEEFEQFVTNSFNSRIGKIKISDIESLKIEVVRNDNLIADIKSIMEITNLNTDLFMDSGMQDHNLNVLNKYLDEQKKIVFSDLFNIRLHLVRKGERKIVDLKNQIESDGTDRMIRLVLMMSIINQIKINDKRNKIILFIDEVLTIDAGNRSELVDFCKHNFFLPIFASIPPLVDGFDKYYLLRRTSGKIVVSKNNGNVIIRNPKVK